MQKILSLQLWGAMLVLLSSACDSKKAAVVPAGTGGATSGPAATGGAGAGGTTGGKDAGGLGTGGSSGTGGLLGSGGKLAGGGASGSGGLLGTGGSVDAGAADIIYQGCVWSGGLDHMSIQKQDLARDICLVLQLASPSSTRTGYTVSVPDRWGLMWASLSPCGGTGTAVGATTVTGTITWTPGTSGYLPDTLDVDVVMTFGTADGGASETHVFSAKGIPVGEGC